MDYGWAQVCTKAANSGWQEKTLCRYVVSMNRTLNKVMLLSITVLLLAAGLWFVFHFSPFPMKETAVPDFAAIENVQEKKDAFFEFMLPIVRRANDAIREERQLVNRFKKSLESGRGLSKSDAMQLAELMKKYRLKGDQNSVAKSITLLLRRVDTIPAALVLAQSANESAWGTSRFAREGNNYFGLWCWSKECGMLPTERDDGAIHEVASFTTVEAGTAHYMQTLNSHPAYQLLRDLRTTLKTEGKTVKGWDLAGGLLEYSERRENYIEEIREMIIYNDLRRFARIKYDH